MRRLLLILFSSVLLLALAPAAATARTYSVDVPKALAKPVADLKSASDIPVLLPSRLLADRKRLYGRGTASAGGYELGLDAIRGCGGANACAVAFFSAERGGEPFATNEVRLANQITGYFKPLSCGASCSPPSIEWLSEGILYEIQADAGSRRMEKRRLITLADSAIKNGPR